MKEFGLIGYPLGHSFSARYFAEKFAREGIDARYTPHETATLNGEAGLAAVAHLDGFNVTYPHKEAIIPYLDALDGTASAVGAVNVVKRSGGRLTGYNTDCTGFAEDLAEWFSLYNAAEHPGRAMVLGTGGAAKAVVYGLRQKEIEVTVVSRDAVSKKGLFGDGVNMLNYNALSGEVMRAHPLIANCTPLGMTPDTGSCPPVPYEYIGTGHWLYDCVYNPAETLFLREGRMRGARTRNGLGMLQKQAEAAWAIWSAGQ